MRLLKAETHPELGRDEGNAALSPRMLLVEAVDLDLALVVVALGAAVLQKACWREKESSIPAESAARSEYSRTCQSRTGWWYGVVSPAKCCAVSTWLGAGGRASRTFFVEVHGTNIIDVEVELLCDCFDVVLRNDHSLSTTESARAPFW